jgi:hypothetical protein
MQLGVVTGEWGLLQRQQGKGCRLHCLVCFLLADGCASRGKSSSN